MRVGLLAVVALALTAGCAGLGGGDSTTEEFTPAPVPEVSTTDEASNRVAPGLSPGGVSDVGSLARAHREALDGTAYTWRFEEASESTRENVTYPTGQSSVLRVESDRRYLYHTDSRSDVTGDGPRFFGNYTEFADGDARYVRYNGFETQGNWTYDRRSGQDATSSFAPRATDGIRLYLDLDNPVVIRTSESAPERYRIVGHPESIRGIGPVEEADVDAVVTADGFVRSLRAEFVAPDQQRRYRYQFEYTRVGTTTVEEPDWVDDQLNGTRSE